MAISPNRSTARIVQAFGPKHAILRVGGDAMSRFLTVGAAQMGPIQRSHTRHDVVERMIAHLREANRMGCELVVFPELTLTTFFPRWWMPDQAEIDSFFEREMPSNETAPLFNETRARHELRLCRAHQ
jgi:hypothetical protein